MQQSLKRLYRFKVFLVLFFIISILSAQENNAGRISGNLEFNTNFFLRDSAIGAANIPQYDRQLFGADAWLNLGYSNWVSI